MSTAEYIFAAIGILVILGGFAYGIYDSYFQSKDEDPSPKKKKH